MYKHWTEAWGQGHTVLRALCLLQHLHEELIDELHRHLYIKATARKTQHQLLLQHCKPASPRAGCGETPVDQCVLPSTLKHSLPPPPLSAASSPADSQLSSSPSSMRKTVSGESVQHSSFTFSVAVSVNLSPHTHIHTRASTHAQ